MSNVGGPTDKPTIGNSIAAILANPTIPAPLRGAWQRFKCEFIKFDHVKSILSRSARAVRRPEHVRRSETPKQITISQDSSVVEVIDNGSSESGATSEPERGTIAIEFLRRQSSRSNVERDQICEDKEQKGASDKIRNTQDERVQVHAPNFRNLNLASREEAAAAIHDLARFMSHQTRTPDAFKFEVKYFLVAEVLGESELESLLKHASAVHLAGASNLVREALAELILEEQEAIRPTRAQNLAPVENVEGSTRNEALAERLLKVENQVDYLEVLADIADAARLSAPAPEFFRAVVARIVGSTIDQEHVANIVRRYPAFGTANPLARMERGRRLESAMPVASIWAERKVDEIDIVAEVLGEAAGLQIDGRHLHGSLGVDRRQQNDLISYRSKILASNGDVRQALLELRAEEMEKPARRGRRPPTRRVPPKAPALPPQPTLQPNLRPESMLQAMSSPPPSAPPLSPRSQALAEKTNSELGNPQDYQVVSFKPRAARTPEKKQ